MKQIEMLLFIAGYMLAFALSSQATIEKRDIFSVSMKKNISVHIVVPANHKEYAEKSFPVVYLLHGFGGNSLNWISSVPALTKLSDRHDIMIVCPDGGNSWYIDSPIDAQSKYETHITAEVTHFIDSNFHTVKQSSGRAITGFSMGGYGGLYLGLRNPAVFGACGSMSGGVDLAKWHGSFDIEKRLGSNPDYWSNYSISSVTDTALASARRRDSKARLSPIIIDCGTEDFFFRCNRALHKKLLDIGVAHDYIEKPGGHDWVYWTAAVEFQMLFFSRFFESSNTKS